MGVVAIPVAGTEGLAVLPGDRGAAGGIRYRFRGHEVILVMREVHGLTACPMCDTLHRRVHLKDGQRARCRVCGSELARSSRLNRARMIPLVLTCLLLFVMANVFPIVAIELQGTVHQLTLVDAVTTLLQSGMFAVALMVFVSTLFLPGLYLLTLLFVL